MLSKHCTYLVICVRCTNKLHLSFPQGSIPLLLSLESLFQSATMLFSTIGFAIIWLCAVDAKNQDGSTSYDFVIVGGGTSGLVVANRLSEMSGFTVAVIEAGDSVLKNVNVSTVTGYGKAFGTEIDWAYQTEDQTYAGGSKQIMRAGKAIGGTSTINGN